MELSLRHQYEILENKMEEDRTHLKLKVVDDSLTPNELVSSVLPFGKIISFNEVVPSMNDIFIKVVEENKKQ